ncbi:MAG TPA: hypothetical protein VMV10_02965 [Pirellulales bacterium]|nr:hypothetical protein [Pirellulales bacterium]
MTALKERMRQAENLHHAPGERLTTGISALDRLLPQGGLSRAALVEWLGEPGAGASTLALLAAREACREGGSLVAIDRPRRLYPPAAAMLGIDLEKLIVVRPQTQADERWAVHQALSCPAVAAVLCWPEKLDDRTARRWQLAAERGKSLGLLVRPEQALAQPAWSELRLLVRALPAEGNRRWQVEVVHGRGASAGKSVELEFDDATSAVHLAPELADSTPHARPAGA